VGWGSDHGDIAADEIGRQLRQPIIATLGPTIFDRDIPSFVVAGFGETLSECSYLYCSKAARPTAMQKSDNGGYRLLPPRRERPHGRAANKRDEFASFHRITSRQARRP
jgi:hypothetical protein